MNHVQHNPAADALFLYILYYYKLARNLLCYQYAYLLTSFSKYKADNSAKLQKRQLLVFGFIPTNLNKAQINQS